MPNSFLLLEDGVSYLLLEDGVSKLILETAPAPPPPPPLLSALPVTAAGGRSGDMRFGGGIYKIVNTP